MISMEDPTNDPSNFYKRVKIVLQDMGIQDYTSVGNPVHRYRCKGKYSGDRA